MPHTLLFPARRRNSAFTLIEILVVIAIIAILAAIFFPVFARARENARRSSCQSNLKQIGLGLIQYAQDYDERLPQAYFGCANNDSTAPGVVSTAGGCATAPAEKYKWMDATFPYVKSEQIYNCPSAPDTSLDAGGGVLDNVDDYGFRDGNNYGSYVYNNVYGHSNTNAANFPKGLIGLGNTGRALADLAVPATTVWVMDGNGNYRVFTDEYANYGTTTLRRVTVNGTEMVITGNRPLA